MDKRITYTLGYGRTTRGRFSGRILALKEKIEVELTGPLEPKLSIIDVRKPGSKSMNGKWCWHSNQSIWSPRPRTELTLKTVLTEMDIGYSALPYLYNEWGSSQSGLEYYRNMLEHKVCMRENLLQVCDWITDGLNRGYRFCLLCAEEKPFKQNGQPNCHRVILADEIAKRIGIEVVHVGDNRKPNFFDGWEKVSKGIEL